MMIRDYMRLKPRALSDRARTRVMRFGTAGMRVDAVRAWAQEGAEHHLVRTLGDQTPGVRRAGARGLGWSGQSSHVEALQAAFAVERMDTVRVALSGALIRCGVPWQEQFDALKEVIARKVLTARGPRVPGLVTLHSPSEVLTELSYEIGRIDPGPPRTRADVVEQLGLHDNLNVDSRGFADALFPIAAQDPDGLSGWLVRVEPKVQKVARYAIMTAMGFNGAPHLASWLHGALLTGAVSPAIGFRQRTIAAIAIGGLGLPNSVTTLMRALTREKREYEGTPGSGLGIQLPVRSFIIWALGELGDPRALPSLIPLLDNQEGSALSGYDLPAMGAIVKIGELAKSALLNAAFNDPVGQANVETLRKSINADGASGP